MYKNYGDVNFFEYGRLVQKESETEFRIIVCDPYQDQEDKYQFTKALIDITDSWIDKERVMNYGDMTEENFDPILFALDCISYYGAHEFGIVFDLSKEQIIENLDEYLSDEDIEDRSCYKEGDN